MRDIEILKKNRKYFAAILEGKYKVKLLIDNNSESLQIGKHQLQVEDISVRSKYGTDLIFKLAAPAEEQEEAGICTLRSDQYNQILRDKCRKLGGKFDSNSSAWIFSGIVADEVENLDAVFNSELVTVEITASADISKHHELGPVSFCGITVARAFGRDSGAKLGDDVYQLSGAIRSGGSRANYTTRIDEGSQFRLQLPKLVLKNYYNEEDGFSYAVLD